MNNHQMIAQQQLNVKTGIIGIAPGQYRAFIAGKESGFVYGRTYADALTQFHRLLDEVHNAPPAPVDWIACPDCGDSVDVGEDCPHCAGEQVFVGGIKWGDDIPWDGRPAHGQENSAADYYGLEARW